MAGRAVQADDLDAAAPADDLEASVLACARNVVAFIGGTPVDWRAVVVRAASIALATNGRITLVAGTRRWSTWSWGALGAPPPVPAAELAKHLEKILREASALVPNDVPVVMVAGFGSPKRVLGRVLADGRTDLILVSRGLARTQRARRRLACLGPVEVVAMDARARAAVRTPYSPRPLRMHLRMVRLLSKIVRGGAALHASGEATEDGERDRPF